GGHLGRASRDQAQEQEVQRPSASTRWAWLGAGGGPWGAAPSQGGAPYHPPAGAAPLQEPGCRPHARLRDRSRRRGGGLRGVGEEEAMALEDLASFVAAAQHGSLTAASRALGVPKSTISRRLARLEEEVGQQLVRRTSRTFRLTEAGEALYRRSAPALLDLDEALQATRDAGATPAGELRITALVDLGGSHVFASWMAEFTRTWPRIRL